MLDIPNARSSHQQPTPRGGGLAIVVSWLLALAALLLAGVDLHGLLLAVAPGFLAIAIVGWVDDRRGVPPSIRLLVHLVGAAWCIGCVMQDQHHWIGRLSGLLAFVIPVLLAIGIAWATNLFNFMDGIDGIAASQAVFIASLGAVLCCLDRDQPGSLAMLAMASSCAGFLAWNFPPARIFMGDAGSGALGFALASAPLVLSSVSYEKLFPWMILWGAFVADASVTLVRRLLRRQRLSQAHRSHAYQRLSRRWSSHRRVTLSFAGVNLFWLSPLAMSAWYWPSMSIWLTVVAWAPLAAFAIWAGAGRDDN
jgi:Fuc2NAc and GlcNAc transferase